MRRLAIALLFLLLNSALHATIPWPIVPFDSAQPIGNSYGEYQNYGGAPYMHPGIDILHPAGTHVYAVKAGWVKAVLTTAAELHWRVAIGDSPGADSCNGWLYAHLDEPTIPVTVGQHVDSGQFLGDLVQWPIANFHHCHFVKIRNAGTTWSSNWLFVGNALDELVNIDDFAAPYFVDFSFGVPFRFCADNSVIFFNIGASVSGDVDIIAHAQDRVGHPTWVLSPYAMGYEIYSDSVLLGPYTSFTFTGKLLWDQATQAIYKESGPCVSYGDYDERQFYEIITNRDNDPLITPSDISGKWATGQIPNDTYTIKAWAKDRYGTITWDSMEVVTANYYNIAGTVSTSDGNPYNDQVFVSVPYSGASDSTAISGSFLLPSQPAGRYTVTTSRVGYQSRSTIYDVFNNLNLAIVLSPAPFVNGDVDHDGIVNVSDVVYLINFIFAAGAYPVPWAAGVNIDPSPNINISDVVYLIDYVFGNGPPPGGAE